jgi:hypothetical protein
MGCGSSGLWHPGLLGSDLVAWWRADGLADGAPATWVDRVIPKTLTATGTPTKASNSFNSAYPGVTFNGTTDYLQITNTTSLPSGATAGMIFVHCSATDTAAVQVAFGYGNTGAISRRVQVSATEEPAVSDGTTITSGTAGEGLGPALICGRWSGTTQEGWRNGTAFAGNPGVIATLATATNRTRLGASTAGTPNQFFAGVIRHVFVTLDLSTANRQFLEGWIMWDSGLQASLPGDHPYQTVRPGA